MLLRDEDDKATVLFHSVIYNSVVRSVTSGKHVANYIRKVLGLLEVKIPKNRIANTFFKPKDFFQLINGVIFQ